MKTIHIATCQMARWNKMDQTRIQNEDLIGLDITIKSGDGAFAPTWNMVMSYKDGWMCWEDYVREYLELMRNSYIDNRDHWESVIQSGEGRTLVLICYCAPQNNCHRHLLKKYFKKVAEKMGYDVVMKGEIR